MRRSFSRLSVFAVLLASSACDQEMITLDSGTPASLSVRAYVDVDGNGVFDGSDIGVGSATITVSGEGGEQSATTDDSGLASFAALSPGSYTLSISGAAPQGAVLTGATNPVVAAPFRGGALSAEFRYAQLPGSIGGRLFRDDNASGVYEAEFDLPAAGILMTLSDGQPAAAGAAGTSQAVVAQLSTDAGGAFLFDVLRPGSYTLEVGALETMEIVGGATQTVSVGAGISVPFEVMFTGTLLISIADARNAPDDQTVTVEGVVTFHPTYDNRTYFLQDETAGISVFDFDRPDIVIGDRIQITGSRGGFRGEIQVSPIITLENLGNVGEPTPRRVTGEDINAGTFAGELVVIDGTVQIVDVLSFDNQMVTLRDASGTDFTVFADSRTGVMPAAWTVGSVFAVSGVLGTDDRNDLPHRIEVRSPDDVVAGGTTISIAAARGMSGETVVIQGVVTWQDPVIGDRVFFFQDATAGISAFFSAAPSMNRGDLIQIQGEIGAFRGETQISPDNLIVLGTGAVPSPRGISAADINAGVAQGELVTVTGTLQSVTEVSFGNQDVVVRDAAGTDLNIFVDSRNGVVAGDWPALSSTVRVTGVLGTDDRNTPGPRIELRDINDIVVATPGQTSIAEARQMVGSTVTVEGILTWQNAAIGNRVFFFQDDSGGLSAFESTAPALNEGDRIRLTGDISQFRGETQIGSVTDFVVVGGGTAPPARMVSAAQVNDGLFQGELVEVTGTLLSVVELSFGNQDVTVQDATGTSVSIFVDSRNGMATGDWPATGTMVQVKGVLGTDDRNDPGPRIEVRSTADVTTVPPAN
jgi:DNA/RNA endonuclease YhcR with UshA esterase domain